MTTRKTPSGKRAEKTPDESTDECFTIMPFGGWFDDYYTDVFVPAIKDAGLVPRRADDLYRPSAIVHDIWSYTRSCKLVLADLTGKNPNVFYELGLAHAIAKPAILVTESINDVPFDLRALRVIEYDKNAPAWGEILRGKIENSIREIVAAPLQSVLPSFLNVEKPEHPPVTEHQREILEIRQELELLKRELRRSTEARQTMGSEELLRRLREIQVDPSPAHIDWRTYDFLLSQPTTSNAVVAAYKRVLRSLAEPSRKAIESDKPVASHPDEE